MTQEEKQLLLKDLCARLPYGVEIICEASPMSLTLSAHMLDEIIKDGNKLQWKPYLRPISSMTEEEENEYNIAIDKDIAPERIVDWYNRHHIDYRGLIPMGLALEASEGMYKIE